MVLFIQFIVTLYTIFFLFLLISVFRFRSTHVYKSGYIIPGVPGRFPVQVNSSHSLEVSFWNDVNVRFMISFFTIVITFIIILFLLLRFL